MDAWIISIAILLAIMVLLCAFHLFITDKLFKSIEVIWKSLDGIDKRIKRLEDSRIYMDGQRVDLQARVSELEDFIERIRS